MKTAIEVTNLYKTFKNDKIETTILKNIQVTINEGEFVSIMGPSGSGKSTLLYLIGGLDKPTSGSIKIKGKDIAVMSDNEASNMRCRNVGFVFQFYNLIPNLSVEENILLPILLEGKSEKLYKEKLDEILEDIGLSTKRKYTPKQLSGGQQQRVAIARALINEPDIILADEPIGNLDSKTGNEIMELLRKINREKGKTIVQVTHSQESSTYGNRTIFLKDGMIQN
ncbi:putative ABC transport system ATP-binding protein [Clostridium acetobutylicum]|uniref:ABC-type transport system, ATPase component n=1 Tax=Clostridium acetobutylicum (strain ATCC 824 / DSM 792 / JCM 1419 / IAM 19013 / LMG 5710 / NBRC 13948 / NRRL B-527 / VKM B-1787 / 2291 / W) TaxID=272562 RepID=Q97HL3_CLOAB|nr:MULTISPECIES: ABC transporter ATP-binding protein [Clostridium]AAK79957.1 ABC-type transport system, ATPase component [Clostridium acetobutylicum ATCC 824]ADZ21050.1 ABC-type transport system, ATPase component [Clostridium acetobutylicum EA 2018]AEI34318.1 ABC transporter, ATPase component [Clostridium acetobutylicum DSM 1731]AWV79611.1 ABC transporter ATP-binding protein [Clostridium acetobutylicum]MBC2394415.1 ABC transporter ATP-binding protein [Clostridium acetobutylicum]